MAQIATKANSLIIAAFVLIFALIALVYARYENEGNAAQSWVQHSNIVLGRIKDLSLAFDEAETGQRGFLLSGRDDYLQPYEAARDRAPNLFAELKELTADNPDQQARLTKLGPVMEQKFEELAQTIQLRRSARLDDALKLVNSDRGKELMQTARQLLREMYGSETTLLESQLANAAASRVITAALLACGIGAAFVLILIGGYLLRASVRQRQRAEDAVRDAAVQLRVAFDSLSQGIAVFDADRRLANWNHCFVELLRMPRELVAVGARYETVAETLNMAGEFLETEAQIRERDRLRGPADAVVYERQRPDGHVFELRRTALPAGGFAVTFTDITTKVRAEQVQRNLQRMQALGQLTGGVAHDFNNLLTVIAGNLDLMRGKLPAESDLTRYVAAALRAADRGATLTGQLLAFGRRQPLAPKPVDLNRLASELTSGMLRRTLGEPIDIKVVESAGLWPAFADPVQLESAVLNLALNARDAMPQGGKLTIETANVTLDERYAEQHEEVMAGQYVMIAVSDTGTGMPADIAEHAFEPFFTTKDEGKGSGLGLAMVHGFTKQSKGHVKIYSEPGSGTTVKIYLPRSARAAIEETQSPAALPHGSASILVVEDDPDVRRVVVAQLGELGYRVAEAADAESGLKVLTEAKQIDLLLTDVVLPGRLRGRDLAELVRRASPGTKILFMSGYTENAIVHDGKLDEGTLLLSKPFRREDLAKKVAQALGSQKDGSHEENVVRLPQH